MRLASAGGARRKSGEKERVIAKQPADADQPDGQLAGGRREDARARRHRRGQGRRRSRKSARPIRTAAPRRTPPSARPAPTKATGIARAADQGRGKRRGFVRKQGKRQVMDAAASRGRRRKESGGEATASSGIGRRWPARWRKVGLRASKLKPTEKGPSRQRGPHPTRLRRGSILPPKAEKGVPAFYTLNARAFFSGNSDRIRLRRRDLENRIGDGGGDRRRAGLADAAPFAAARQCEMRFDGRRIGHARDLVVVEIALLDCASSGS